MEKCPLFSLSKTQTINTYACIKELKESLFLSVRYKVFGGLKVLFLSSIAKNHYISSHKVSFSQSLKYFVLFSVQLALDASHSGVYLSTTNIDRQ